MLFRSGNPMTDGVALKLKSFAKGLLSTDGLFSSKDASLKRQLDANSKDQAEVNDKATRVEAALTAKYSALDVKLTQLTSLSAYVTQQVSQWNKTSA